MHSLSNGLILQIAIDLLMVWVLSITTVAYLVARGKRVSPAVQQPPQPNRDSPQFVAHVPSPQDIVFKMTAVEQMMERERQRLDEIVARLDARVRSVEAAVAKKRSAPPPFPTIQQPRYEAMTSGRLGGSTPSKKPPQ